MLQNGETPLHIASNKGDANVVRILTRSGANINLRNNVRKLETHNYVVTYMWTCIIIRNACP